MYLCYLCVCCVHTCVFSSMQQEGGQEVSSPATGLAAQPQKAESISEDETVNSLKNRAVEKRKPTTSEG